MEVRTSGDYELADREVVAEGADLRVQVLTLAARQCIPWHYHSEITDAFVCLEGPMVVETRAPPSEYLLTPGQRCAVPPKTAH
jgi:quercetin dioxygenase-like cupin family protein